jgi:rod shape-determining protein MreD
MAKYLKLAALAAVGLFLLLLQFSFIGALPFAWRQFNLVLVFLLLILFFFGFEPAVWLAVILGFFSDLLSFDYFGLQLLVLPLVLIFAHLWLVNWFTNRSVYSFLALTLAATVLYNLVFYASIYIIGRFFSDSNDFFLWQGNFWSGLGLQIISNSVSLFLFFIIANFFSTRFKPVFLDKK